MKSRIDRILNEYVSAKKEVFAGHPLGAFFRNEFPNYLYSAGIVDSEQYLVTGSVGQGNWATVPWVCIFDKNITTSATKGVYIVYLLAKDGKTLYLTFNQGCTDIRNSHSKSETIKIMRKRAAEIVDVIDSRGFASDENINLGSSLTDLAELYQKGTIFYKGYEQGNVPSSEILINDLKKMMEVYKDYVSMTKVEPIQLHGTGSFDSWDIIDEKTAIKHCDKSFFDYRQSGVPKDICWFFGADNMQPGESKDIQLMYNSAFYQGTIKNETSDRRRVRISWGSDLGRLFDEFNASGSTATFKIIGKDSYAVYINCGENEMSRTVLEKVIKSLEELGGKGTYSQIYEKYEDITGEVLTDGKKAGIRKTIEDNSSDSDNFRGNDIFYSVEGKGRGIWGLRNYKNELISCKDRVDLIKQYISAKGFNYEGDLIENFYLSLKSKPFVILAGTSGTGKTRLVKLFKEAIGAQMQLVPVRPDWSDSSDLFGYTDLSGNFKPGAIIDFIKRAEWDKDTPYFLCLDEMNLARVEYYLSDFLSVIETRDRNANGVIETESLVDESYFKSDDARKKYGRVYIPENLYIIGTVNMDETTFPFSKKVLDRANTIEFSYVNLSARAAFGGKAEKQTLDNSFLKNDYLYLHECDDEDLVDAICFDLEELNQILVKANLHVGYRVRDEICIYMMNNKKSGLLPEAVAFDHQIMQKILPRIQGSSSAIKDVLSEMFIKCAGDYAGFSGISVYEQMNSYLLSKPCKYPNSAKKIAFMMRRYEEDGFTSYWL